MSALSRRALVADIGGTNIRFAISDVDELTISDFALLSTGDFSGPEEALERYLKTIPRKPSLVGLAVAGPVRDDTVMMTNRPWTFSATDIAALTGAEHVCIVNDFEALALAIPHLSRYDLQNVGGAEPHGYGTKAILGPGTGLGVAASIHTHDGWTAIASEGGHVGFGAQTEPEARLLRSVAGTAPFIAAEDVLSGRGLVALHAALAETAHGRPLETAEAIVRAAVADRHPAAIAAVEQFVTWLGRFAGDVALTFGASGGVYLAGGIVPNIAAQVSGPRFRAAFEGKGPLTDYLRQIPAYIVKTGADAGLRGAALALAQRLPPVGSRRKRLHSVE